MYWRIGLIQLDLIRNFSKSYDVINITTNCMTIPIFLLQFKQVSTSTTKKITLMINTSRRLSVWVWVIWATTPTQIVGNVLTTNGDWSATPLWCIGNTKNHIYQHIATILTQIVDDALTTHGDWSATPFWCIGDTKKVTFTHLKLVIFKRFWILGA